MQTSDVITEHNNEGKSGVEILRGYPRGHNIQTVCQSLTDDTNQIILEDDCIFYVEKNGVLATGVETMTFCTLAKHSAPEVQAGRPYSDFNDEKTKQKLRVRLVELLVLFQVVHYPYLMSGTGTARWWPGFDSQFRCHM